MFGPVTRSRRRSRCGPGVVLGVLALAGATGVAACTSPDAGSPTAGRGAAAASAATASTSPAGPTAGTASAGAVSARTASAGAVSPAAVTAEVTGLLRGRADALVAGDASAFARTVADRTAADGRRQLDSYAAARALRVSRLEVGIPVVNPGASDSGTPASPASPASPESSVSPESPLRATAVADVRYRVDDLDRGDRAARLQYDLVRTTAGWQVESERPVGTGATAPWVAMPTLRVRRGEDAVVAGTVSTGRLAEHAAVVDRALPALRRQWPGTPARVLVLAPSSPGEADALLGRPSGSDGSPVAATTEGPTGAGGTATGDRVVVDPTAFARLTESGRDVVLTHELAHVVVRSTVAGRPAAWLAEGYADHVGYSRADVSTGRLVAPLVSALRTGHGPRALPGAADLRPSGGDIEVPYLAAWQAVELIADDHGEAALRRLIAAGSSTGSDADAEAATDRALVTVLGTTRAELTDRWLTRLGQLATNPS